MRILGVDPGLTRCGVGIIDKGDPRSVKFVEVTVFRSPADAELSKRLLSIRDDLAAIFDRLKPDVIAIERVFSQQNLRTVMGTAQVAGIALLAAAQAGTKVVMHTPSEVKAAVTGSGRAKKDQVAQMVQRILKLETIPKPVDATDALALAICHVWRGSGNDRVAAAVVKEKKRLLALRGSA